MLRYKTKTRHGDERQLQWSCRYEVTRRGKAAPCYGGSDGSAYTPPSPLHSSSGWPLLLVCTSPPAKQFWLLVISTASCTASSSLAARFIAAPSASASWSLLRISLTFFSSRKAATFPDQTRPECTTGIWFSPELLTSEVAGEEELCVPISLPSIVERRRSAQTVISAAVFRSHQPTLNNRSQAWWWPVRGAESTEHPASENGAHTDLSQCRKTGPAWRLQWCGYTAPLHLDDYLKTHLFSEYYSVYTEVKSVAAMPH